MVLLPDQPIDTMRNAYDDAWRRARDGKGLQLASATAKPRIDRVFSILSDFVSRDGHKIKYKAGMQGHYLGSQANEDGMEMALIFIRGITVTGPDLGEANKWVPKSKIQLGPDWESDVSKYTIDVNAFKALVSWRNPPRVNRDDRLSRSIRAIIQAWVDTPANFVGERFFKLVENRGIALITNAILAGIDRAGLYQVLLKQNFTASDIIRTAMGITATRGVNQKGIYLRFHKTGDCVEYWQANTTYAYVGQAKANFSERYKTHRSNTSRYGYLSKGSKELHMCAVCVLPDSTEDVLYYVAEQVFVSLFGTYKWKSISDAHHATDASDILIVSLSAALYFNKVSAAVFADTGYVAATSRPRFGIANGANFRSPLEELGKTAEKILYILTHHTIRDHDAQESIAMVELRRSQPKSAHWSPSDKNKTKSRLHLAMIKGAQDKTLNSFDVYCPRGTGGDGNDYPKEGDLVHIIFEVRLDGKPIKNSWARLADVAIFKNWSQANSFAVRYEWEYPKNSGKWRYGYCQHGSPGTFIRANKNIDASFIRYGKAVATWHFLLGVKPNYTAAWIPKPVSYARVIQVNFDYMKRAIYFTTPEVTVTAMPAARNSPANIEQQMNAAGLGGPRSTFRLDRRSAKRKVCDLCCLLNQVAFAWKLECTEEEDLCAMCKLFGLPRCSWTSNVISDKTLRTSKNTVTPEELDARTKIRTALATQPMRGKINKLFQQELVALKDNKIAEESEDEAEDDTDEDDISDDNEEDGGMDVEDL